MIDEYFESSRRGVHIVGELGGMGLIRNAVTQGLQAAERLAETTPKGNGSATDVLIIGAGPAGTAAGRRPREAWRWLRLVGQGIRGGAGGERPRGRGRVTRPSTVP